jgi:hypothetical protein
MSATSPSEDELRARAHQLWEADGCPTGRTDEFWHRARKELAHEDVDYDTTIEDSFPASDPPSHSGTTGPKSPV